MAGCLVMGHSKWGRLDLGQYARRIEAEDYRLGRNDTPRDADTLLELARAIERADANSVDEPEGNG